MTSPAVSSFRSVILLAFFSGFLPAVQGEELYSPVSGFLKVQCRGGSDTRVSAPFHPVPVWSGPIAAPPQAAGGGIIRLTVALPSGIGVGAFTATPHWVLCRAPSDAAGRHFFITAHNGGSIDVEGVADDWTGVSTGGGIEVIPAWTLDSLFPPGQQSTFHLSTGRLAPDRQSELLLFNQVGKGTKLAPSRRYFITNSGWTSVNGFAAAGGTIIAPGESFIIRHRAGADPTEFVASEQVYGDVVRLGVRVSQGIRQDTTLAPPRPVKIALADLDLGPASFEESSSDLPVNRKDELLVFDNDLTGLNKTPSAIYFRRAGQWIKDVPGFPIADSVEIEPSAGLLIRKAAGLLDQTAQWPNSSSYDLENP